MAEKDVPKTVFNSHQGTFEFVRMPFGVTGRPAAFQTRMYKGLDGIKRSFAMAFLDGVLLYT